MVDRYDLDEDKGIIEIHPSGGFVDWWDYQTLEEKYESLRRAVANLYQEME